ncbi:flavodoxin family protein [Methanogenium sp. S4BF]|uniref:flavodoxin family protein n=1 Tax=Methanogenium sp. S4BF TaxID=1789226 RepID=UPI0024159E51|nr:flavodoxin family protein [Methanogenium sp. S4BF]WFN33970.1 flavodoxin family protein [Methanogenium sp. S4BF]
MIREIILERRTVQTAQGDFLITCVSADLTHLYPGMERYGVRVTDGTGRTVTEFFTNTYEYTPAMELDAKSVAFRQADEWEGEFTEHPTDMVEYFSRLHPRCLPAAETADVVIIQGSPRPDGNCGQTAGLIAAETDRAGGTVQVLYPDDMDIHPCIGCYQCYNTGYCTFADDMDEVFVLVQRCRVLAVCAPVYSCSVPGALKALIDRFQAYHARRNLTDVVQGSHQAGLFFGVCGREGEVNFIPLRAIATAFFATAGIPLTGTAWADGMDRKRDVRQVSGFPGEVRSLVRQALEGAGDWGDQ